MLSDGTFRAKMILDLIDAASKTSPSLEEVTPDSNDLRAWLAECPANEKENLLAEILESSMKGNHAPASMTVHRFNKIWQSQLASKMGNPKQQRTVAKLLKEAEYITQERHRIETKRAEEEQAEKKRLCRLMREKRLNEIVGSEPLLWGQIDSLASEKKAVSYNKAMELLVDLRDLAARGDHSDFLVKFDALKQRHSAKSSFISRLRKLDLAMISKKNHTIYSLCYQI